MTRFNRNRGLRPGGALAVMLGIVLTLPALGALAQGGLAVPEFERFVIDSDPPSQPYYKMVGDLTGDGNLEIVIAGRTGPLVMYTRPDWKKTVIAEGGYEGGVRGEIADINGDGKPDILMGGIVWFENPGGGGGAWPVHRVAVQRIHDVLAADLTGNGLLDVVGRDQSAFGRRDSTIHIFYQDVPNTWRPESLEVPHGEGVAIADLDGDGRKDIVAGQRWFRNTADGWIEHVYTTGWTHPHAKVGVGDINGDGRPDIVLTPAELRNEHYRISWFEAPAGDKTCTWKEHVIVSEIECVVHALALGDFNQDGALDVAYAEMHQGADPDEVVVMLNAGAGAKWEKLMIDAQGSHDIVAADFTGNGALDIMGANHAGVAPVVLWKNAGRRPLARNLPLDAWTHILADENRASRKFGLWAADFNGNGALDIVSGEYFYLNPGGDMSGAWTRRDLPTPDMDGLIILDVNGNGVGDVIAMDSKGDVYWLEPSDPGASAWKTHKIGTMGEADHKVSAQGYTVGQLRPGAKPEIVITITDNISYFQIPEDPIKLPWPKRRISSSNYKERVIVVDMDGDGHNDVVCSSSISSFAWWRNPGTDAENWERIEIGPIPGRVADRLEVGDINGDGKLEVVVSAANGDHNGIYIFSQPEGGPAAGEWSRRELVRQRSTNSMDMADMNNNGLVDIVSGEHQERRRVGESRDPMKLIVWANDGRGEFTSHVVAEGWDHHLGTRVYDLDGDGDLDIVSIGWAQSQYLHIWRNDALPAK